MKNYAIEGQLSIFDILAAVQPKESVSPVLAMCIANRKTAETRKPTPAELKLVPNGEYVVLVDKKPFVLCETDVSESEVPEGHKYFKNT